MSTGFLFFDNQEQSKRNIQKQTGRLIKLYITWTIAYCPLVILEMIKDKKLTPMGFTEMLQKFVFSGIYYHLWYIPAAAVALFVVWTLKKRIRNRNILILFTILFIIGLLDDSYAGVISGKIFAHYNKVFLTTRNGVFFGGLLVEIGSVIAKYKEKMRNFREPLLFCMAGAGSCLLIVESMWNYSILGEHVNGNSYFYSNFSDCVEDRRDRSRYKEITKYEYIDLCYTSFNDCFSVAHSKSKDGNYKCD